MIEALVQSYSLCFIPAWVMVSDWDAVVRKQEGWWQGGPRGPGSEWSRLLQTCVTIQMKGYTKGFISQDSLKEESWQCVCKCAWMDACVLANRVTSSLLSNGCLILERLVMFSPWMSQHSCQSPVYIGIQKSWFLWWWRNITATRISRLASKSEGKQVKSSFLLSCLLSGMSTERCCSHLGWVFLLQIIQ